MSFPWLPLKSYDKNQQMFDTNTNTNNVSIDVLFVNERGSLLDYFSDVFNKREVVWLLMIF